MSKLAGSLLLSSLLVGGLAAASSAQQSFDVVELGQFGNSIADNFDSFTPSVFTNGGASTFSAQLIQFPFQTFPGNSSVSFGNTYQSGAVGTGSYTNVPANFTFELSVPSGGIPKDVAVQGLINGTTSSDGVNGSSDAVFEPQTVLVDGVNQSLISTMSPADRLSFEIADLNFGTGTPINVYLDQTDALTAPGQPNLLSIGGYVQSSVPEPSAMAWLAGMCASGAIFLGRKRRRA